MQTVSSVTVRCWKLEFIFAHLSKCLLAENIWGILSLLPQDFCSPEDPFPPVNSSWLGSAPSPFLLMPNSSVLTWASNVSSYTSWPPLSALRLLASLEGQSCVQACQSVGLMCEPALYRFINIKEAFSA